MDRIGEPVPLFGGDPEQHGWEQIGENHVKTEPTTELAKMIAEYLGDAPFIEGAWMTRHEGTYYLQYAAPGTEEHLRGRLLHRVLAAWAVRVRAEQPVFRQPRRFRHWRRPWQHLRRRARWHASIMRISVHHEFERRVGLFPAGFDADGVLFCNQNFGDYPTIVPDRGVDPWTGTFAGWMLQRPRCACRIALQCRISVAQWRTDGAVDAIDGFCGEVEDFGALTHAAEALAATQQTALNALVRRWRS